MSHPTLDDLIGGGDSASVTGVAGARRRQPSQSQSQRTLDDIIGEETATPVDTMAAHPRSPGDPGGDVVLGSPAPVAPRPAPARGRGIVGALADFFSNVGQYGPGQEQSAGSTAVQPYPEETRRPAYVADRRTATERATDSAAVARARVERLAAHTKLAQQGVFGGGMGGYVTPPDEAAAANEGADLRRRFTPEQWRDIARRGMGLAGRMNAEAAALRATDPQAAEARHQQAEDVSRKAYNAQLLSENAATADTFDAIALSSMVGVLHDPYAAEQRNIADIRANPRLTYTPEEQTALLGKNLPVATEREADPARDLAAPMLGSLPLFVGGDAALLRGARAGSAALGVESAGARGMLARGLSGLARGLSVEEAAADVARPGLAGVKSDVAEFLDKMPDRVRRGAMIGQVPGAVIAAREAQQRGEDVTPAVLSSIAGNAMMGAAGEVLMPAVGLAVSAPRRLLTEGLQNMAVEAAQEARPRLARTLYRLGEDAFERADPRGGRRPAPPPPANDPVDPAVAAPVEAARAAAGKTPLGDQTPEGQHATLARALDELLRAREGEPTFAPSGLIERDERYLTPRPEPVEDNPPLRSAREVAMERAGLAPDDPLAQVDASVQMHRASSAARLREEAMLHEQEQLRLEQAAQARDAAEMGPKTLPETIAQAARDRDAGEPLAAEYHDAISKFADAQARMADATKEGGEPSAKLRLDYARARAVLNDARRKYGARAGVGALAGLGLLAAHNGDLTDEEKRWLGIAGAGLALTTGVVKAIPRDLADRALAAVDNAAGSRASMASWLEHIAINDAPFGEHYPALRREMVALEGQYGDEIPAEAVRAAIEKLATPVPEVPGRAPVQPVEGKLYSRLARAIETLPGKGWDAPRPVGDWIGKLKGLNTFSKAEFALIEPELKRLQAEKAKVTRAEMLALVHDRAPVIERATLGRDRSAPVPSYANAGRDGVRPLDDTDLNSAADVDVAITERENAIGDIRDEIDEAVNTARERLQGAEERVTRLSDRVRGYFHTLVGGDGLDGVLNRVLAKVGEDIDAETSDDAISRLAREVIGDLDEADAFSRPTEPKAPSDSGLVVEDGTYPDGSPSVTIRDPRFRERSITAQTYYEALAEAEWKGWYDSGSTDYLLPYESRVTIREEPPAKLARVKFADGTERVGGWSSLTDERGEPLPFEDAVPKIHERFEQMGKTVESIEDVTDPETAYRYYTLIDQNGRDLTPYDHTDINGIEREEWVRQRVEKRFQPPEMDTDDLRWSIDDYFTAQRDLDDADSRHLLLTEEPVTAFVVEHGVIARYEQELDQLRARQQELQGMAARGEPPSKGEGGPALDEDERYTTPIPPKYTDVPKFEGTQSIGGARDHFELLNVYANNPAPEPYKGGHYGEVPNTYGHVRVEVHDVHSVPGLTGPTVEYPEGESFAARAIRDDIADIRRKIADLDARGSEIVRESEALPAAERDHDNPSPRALRLAHQYRSIQNDIAGYAREEDALVGKLKREIGHTDPDVPAHIAIESQADPSQDAGKFGIKRIPTPEERAAYDAERQPFAERLDSTWERENEAASARRMARRQADDRIRAILNDKAAALTAANGLDFAAYKVFADRIPRAQHYIDAMDRIESAAQYAGEPLTTAIDSGEEMTAEQILARWNEVDPSGEIARNMQEWQAQTARELAIRQERADLHRQLDALKDKYGVNDDSMAPHANVFLDTKIVHGLNAARFLLEVANRGGGWFGWSDAGNRALKASLPMLAADLVYNKLFGGAVKGLLAPLGFKNVEITRRFIKGYGHWMGYMPPEMVKAIRKNGLPIMGVLAALALGSEDAEAQGTQDSQDTNGQRRVLYGTGAGLLAAGALVAAMGAKRGGKAIRAAVAKMREVRAALSLDDLSGLPNKAAFARARETVDRDGGLAWLALAPRDFAMYRRSAGPQAADREIARVGAALRDIARDKDVPLRAFRTGAETFGLAVPKAQAADVLDAAQQAGMTGEFGDTWAEAQALHGGQYGPQIGELAAPAEPAGRSGVGEGRRGRDADARPYTRRSGAGDQEGGLLRVGDREVRAVAEYEPDPALVERHRASGHTAPRMVELDPAHPASVEAFTAGITSAKNASAHGAAVYVYPPEEYAGMRLFLSPTGKTGFALKGHDIVSVFSTEKGGRAAHALAIEAGGRTLDAFDTVLPAIYASNGMRVVSRLPWDESQAPPDWKHATFAKFNGGRPDVVFMVHDPAFTGDRLAGTKASSYDEAVALQQAAIAKLAGPGVTLYSNPIGPALSMLRRYPSAAGVAAVGYAMTQSDNEYVRRAGLPTMALGALHAIGSRRIGAGIDNLAQALVDQLRKTRTGTGVVRAFNPDRLLSPEAREAVIQYERDRAAATGRASRAAAKAKALGPVGDRAASDVLDREAWEGMAAQTPEVLSVALELADEYEKATQAQIAAGTLDPDAALKDYGGPRKYAHYEVAYALADKPGRGGGPGPSPRIAKTQTRTLDIPIREAQARLSEAQKAGDPKAIQDALEALDLAEYEQAAQRVERGEIREASYRAAAGIEKAYHNVAAAKLFETLRALPGVAHPEWLRAIDDFQAARALRKAATTQADKDAADLMVGNATAALDELQRRFKQKGQDYVALPDSPSWGMLRGAIVQRDVAHSLEGFGSAGLYGKALRQWKEMKTVFNVGTNVGNIFSNVVALHMGDVPMWLQPKYYKLAFEHLLTNGEAAQAMVDAGLMHVNVATAEGQGALTSASMRSAGGLEELLATTRPETADVIRRESAKNSEYAITEEGIASRARKRLAKGAAVGGLIGAAKGYDEEHPERVFTYAAAGMGLGALAASGKAETIRRIYGHEDNIARMAIYLRRRALGDTKEQAVQAAIDGLGNFRTRSPALRVAQLTVSPFILYQAKAVPAFAAKIIDHPWKWLSLVALWGGVNELSKREVGAVPEEDRDERDRATWGYFFPGFTQLPITDAEGNKGAVDMARYTPLGGFATGAPPGSVPEALSANAPQVATPGGPVIDLALRAANVHPMTKQPLLNRDAPPSDNIRTLLQEATDFALPTSLGYYVRQVQTDYDNADWAKLKNDMLGPVGTRPRFVRPGGPQQRARHDLEQSLNEIKYQMRRELDANKNPARDSVIIEKYLERQLRAMDNYDRRANPPAPGTRP